MKKVMGYGYKLGSETVTDAFKIYAYNRGELTLKKTRQEVLQEIERDRRSGGIGRRAKARVFSLVMEIEED